MEGWNEFSKKRRRRIMNETTNTCCRPIAFWHHRKLTRNIGWQWTFKRVGCYENAAFRWQFKAIETNSEMKWFWNCKNCYCNDDGKYASGVFYEIGYLTASEEFKYENDLMKSPNAGWLIECVAYKVKWTIWNMFSFNNCIKRVDTVTKRTLSQFKRKEIAKTIHCSNCSVRWLQGLLNFKSA